MTTERVNRLVTADEIAGSLDLRRSRRRSERERLSRVAADIRLVPGEYAVHEGDERALFAVLEGRLETVALVDGIERVVGGRARRGALRRGADRARHAVPGRLPRGRAVARDAGRGRTTTTRSRPRRRRSAMKLGALARGRGSAGCRASRPSRRRLARSCVGHRWDAACAELRRFLDRNQITFTWITPDAPDAAEQWGGPLPADGDCPVIRVVDGKTVVRPQLRRVAELLGARDPAGGGGVRHRDRRRRALRGSRRRSTARRRGCGRS